MQLNGWAWDTQTDHDGIKGIDLTLREQAYSNILKILQPEKEKKIR